MTEDVLDSLVGKLVIGELYNGRTFAAKLVLISGNDIWFQNSNGLRIMNKLSEIKRMYEMHTVVVT